MITVGESLLQAMDIIASSNDASIKADLTILAQIVKQKNLAIGEYLVSYEGSQYSAWSLNTQVVYEINDAVFVKVPQGDFSMKKIIEGKATNENLSDVEIADSTNIVVHLGPNWIDPDVKWYVTKPSSETGSELDFPYPPLKISANGEQTASRDDQGVPYTNGGGPTCDNGIGDFHTDVGYQAYNVSATIGMSADELEHHRYDDQYLTAQAKIGDAAIQPYGTVAEYITLEAKFKTSFNLKHTSGRYSLIAELEKKIERIDLEGYSETVYEIVKVPLDTSRMRGNYLQYNNVWMPADVQIKITPGSIVGLRRIYFTQAGDWESDGIITYDTNGVGTIDDENKIFNIEVKDIWIGYAEVLNSLDTGFLYRIYCPKGYYITRSLFPLLQGELWYRKKEILDPSTSEVRWFRENRYIMGGDGLDPKDYFDRYAGVGWEKIDNDDLSPTDIRSLTEKYSLNKDAFGQITVPYDWALPTTSRQEVPWQWNYKSVCIYGGTEKEEVQVEDLDFLTSALVLFDTRNIINPNSTHEFEIIQDVSFDCQTTYLRVVDKKMDNWETTDLYADWWIEIPETGYYGIANGTRIDVNYDEWFNPKPLEGYTDEQLAKMRPRGRIGINQWGIYDYFIIHAAVADYSKSDHGQIRPGGGTIGQDPIANNSDILGNLSFTIHRTGAGPAVTWVDDFGQGTDGLFTYSRNGKIKWEASSVVHTCYPKISWGEGNFAKYKTEILGPDGIVIPIINGTLSTQPDVEVDTDGANFNDEFMVYNARNGNAEVATVNNPNIPANVIHYNVREEYFPEKAQNNTFTLRIWMDTGPVDYPHTIRFVKDGDQGTNGTEFSVFLAPVYYQEKWAYFPNSIDSTNSGTDLITRVADNVRQPLRWTGTGWYDAQHNGRFPFALFLRPFVYRRGVLIENFDAYTCRVYYDVRYPMGSKSTYNCNSGKINYGNLLRLYYPDFDTARAGTLIGPNAATIASRYPNWIVQAGTFNDKWTPLYINSIPTDMNNKGIVRVRGQYNPEAYDYEAYVVCRVDIYEKDGPFVTSVSTIYPVDIYAGTITNMTEDDKFDKKNLITTWPLMVEYSPNGEVPNNSTKILSFLFSYQGNGIDIADGGTRIAKGNFVNYATKIVNSKPGDGVLAQINGTNEGTQIFEAREKFFWKEGTTVVLQTNNPYSGTDNPLKGTYYRTVVMFLQAFDTLRNIDGWDGRSIDVDEEAGTLLAPTIGSGWIDPGTNKFTGIIMGIDKSQPKTNYPNIFPIQETWDTIYPSDMYDYNPYMVGLYGYQEGVSSFGIMENGTAFFGRADKGARIWIDGFNAWIYGGDRIKNDLYDNPTLVNMTNRMRITLMDITNIGGSSPWTSDDYKNWTADLPIVMDNPLCDNSTSYGTASLKVGGFTDVPGWYYRIIMNGSYTFGGRRPTYANDYLWYKSTEGATIGRTTPPADPPVGPTPNNQNQEKYSTWEKWKTNFNNYYQNYISSNQVTTLQQMYGSVTPAIEIGQHTEGEEGWAYWSSHIVTTEDYWDVVTNMHIPGYRNFLVTYDGTLWCRNAVVQGNIIASALVAITVITGSFYLDPSGEFLVGWGHKYWYPDKSRSSISKKCFSVTQPTWFDPINSGGTGGEEIEGYFHVTAEGITYISDLRVSQHATMNLGPIHISGGWDQADTGDESKWEGSVLIDVQQDDRSSPNFFVLGSSELWGDTAIGGYSYNAGDVLSPYATASTVYESNMVGVGQVHLGSMDECNIVINTRVTKEQHDKRYNNPDIIAKSKKALLSLYGRGEISGFASGMIDLGMMHSKVDLRSGPFGKGYLSSFGVNDGYRNDWTPMYESAKTTNFFRIDVTGVSLSTLYFGSGYNNITEKQVHMDDIMGGVESADSGKTSTTDAPTINRYGCDNFFVGLYPGSKNYVFTISDIFGITSAAKYGNQWGAIVLNAMASVRMATAGVLDLYAGCSARKSSTEGKIRKTNSDSQLPLDEPWSRLLVGEAANSNVVDIGAALQNAVGTDDIGKKCDQRWNGWTSGRLTIGTKKVGDHDSASPIAMNDAATNNYLAAFSREMTSSSQDTEAKSYFGSIMIGAREASTASDASVIYTQQGIHLNAIGGTGSVHGDTANESEVFIGNKRVGIQAPGGDGAIVMVQDISNFDWIHSGSGAVTVAANAFTMASNSDDAGIHLISTKKILAAHGSPGGSDGDKNSRMVLTADTALLTFGHDDPTSEMNKNSIVRLTEDTVTIGHNDNMGPGGWIVGTTDSISFEGDWGEPENQFNIYARFA